MELLHPFPLFHGQGQLRPALPQRKLGYYVQLACIATDGTDNSSKTLVVPFYHSWGTKPRYRPECTQFNRWSFRTWTEHCLKSSNCLPVVLETARKLQKFHHYRIWFQLIIVPGTMVMTASSGLIWDSVFQSSRKFRIQIITKVHVLTKITIFPLTISSIMKMLSGLRTISQDINESYNFTGCQRIVIQWCCLDLVHAIPGQLHLLAQLILF